MVSANLWYSYWTNHIVSSVDPLDPTSTIDRNVGDVALYGLDLESAWQVTQAFSIYASGTLMHSALQSNYDVPVGSLNPVSVPLPVKGKQLVMSPNAEFSIRGQYNFGDFSVGAQAKYEGKRYLDDINSISIDGFTVVNLDAEYNFRVAGLKSVLQLNVDNIFGENYYSRSTTAGNFTPVVTSAGTYGASGGPYLYVGAPPTAYVALKVQY
jgi:iron complex outermembrane receptor protein